MPVELGQKIIDKIHEGSLAPKPRWHFLLKEWLVWVMGALALIVGAAAVSVMRYLAQNNQWISREESGRTLWGWLLLSLPYFWIILLALFLGIFYYYLKHTKRGYRYPMPFIAVIALFASIILGLAFYSVGVGRTIDGVLGRRAPFYDRIFNPNVGYWSHPEDGRLSGLIITRSEQGNSFVLVDRRNGQWTVYYRQGDDGLVVPGQPVRALGHMSGDWGFEAERLMRPMPSGREFFFRFGPGSMMTPGDDVNQGYSVPGKRSMMMRLFK